MGRKFRINIGAWRGPASAAAVPVAIAWVSTLGTATSSTATAAPTRPELEQQFNRTVRPFLQTYCASCHGKESPAAQLDLTGYPTMASVVKGLPHWSQVLEKLAAKQMPPPDFSKQPSAKQVEAVMAWIRAVRQQEATRNAGDPGPVLARRLSNAEYDYTIRDLTGVDLRPTREFPLDPANQEGFDNSGESLTLSPALMKKYVQAARSIADNLVLTSTGMEFASHPTRAETDRDKFCILRIVDFYKRQRTDYAEYFEAAWRYRYRAALGAPDATLNGVAARAGVSPRYLQLVWKTLTDPAVPQPGGETGSDPIVRLQTHWTALPGPVKGSKETPETVRTGCIALRDQVVTLRKKVAWKFDNLKVPRGFSVGGQCFVLWKDRQYASHRRQLYTEALQAGGVPPSRVIPARRRGDKATPEQTITDPADPDLFLPEEPTARAARLESFRRFCSVFPDAFYIAERGRMFVNEPGDKGRLLTAGLHNSMGYFRDDTPLIELILDDGGRRRLNQLWLDFNMVAFVPERMHLEFFVYERSESGTMADPEFNFARAEDKDALSDEKIKRLADLYLAKARKNGGEPAALQAIEEHFRWVSRTIRSTERARLAAEPAHRKALLDFAGRAYRRPLTTTERAGLLAFYQSLQQKGGLSSEEAIADSVISVLMSPSFLFRLDLEGPPAALPSPAKRTVANGRPPGVRSTAPKGIEPLGDYALASRLSYFLWSTMPDKELLSHAAAGDLHRPDVLTAQTRRMLRDPRIRALALEFGGNWLDFRRFEEHNAVDRDRFPTFTNDLREAMFEEPVHFLMDTFQNNRSVLEMLYGRHTFVNGPLARHYGMPDVAKTPANDGNSQTTSDNWVRVANADQYGRGGLLPMAVFLTRNSPGLRTSPVKRGYWVVRRVLGEHIPPPPPNVPDLPKDEGALGDQTLRQALERHRNNPACSGCHARFDSYGLVFEGYGPIGELRKKDLGGKPVETQAPFPGGEARSGVTGLQAFVREQRQQDFLDTLCGKLLSYGLGRSLQPSDEATIREMQKRLAQNGYRFGTLAETIVTSRQFRNRRAPSASLPSAFVKGLKLDVGPGPG